LCNLIAVLTTGPDIWHNLSATTEDRLQPPCVAVWHRVGSRMF
jgi:hypothetical protein